MRCSLLFALIPLTGHRRRSKRQVLYLGELGVEEKRDWDAHRREGRYLLRSNLTQDDPGKTLGVLSAAG